MYVLLAVQNSSDCVSSGTALEKDNGLLEMNCEHSIDKVSDTYRRVEIDQRVRYRYENLPAYDTSGIRYSAAVKSFLRTCRSNTTSPVYSMAGQEAD